MTNRQDLLLLDKKTAGVVDNFLPDKRKIEDLSELFALFAEPTRLRILSVLSISEMCVTDISKMLDINQTTVSHQLKNLRDFGLVKTKRQGKIVFYRIGDIVVSKVFLSGVEYLGY